MVAPLGVSQHEGQGWGHQTSLRRGALIMCQLLRLLLVLLGKQNPFLLQQAEEKTFPKSGEVATEI